MLFYMLVRWVVLAIAIGVTAWLLPGFEIRGDIVGVLVVSAVFGLVNAFIRPIISFLTCPLIILTLGLFTIIINALMLSLTGWLLPQYMFLSGFWTTILASIIISLISGFASVFVSTPEEREAIVVKHHGQTHG